MKETPLLERGILFSDDIMAEEHPAHFKAPMYLSAYSGTTDPVEHFVSLRMQPAQVY
ncbi:UNVERIFIED_CONTAM: hypothetical protein Sradi_3771700 [Sesamum radiatum]|uniref:Uncharacterized protein n=1 Tax=Sesamum radiatum TaxID=300843 RepID=A0AAW2PZH4_SESRA